MKKRSVIAVFGASTILGASLLTGCTPGNNVPGATVTGAAAGGLLGAALFHGQGSIIGILGGALVGGVIGNAVGQHMDARDRANMAQAVTTTPVGEETTWSNNDATYTVRPTRQYHRNDEYCREFQTTIVIGGKIHKAYGTACRQPDGQWKIIK